MKLKHLFTINFPIAVFFGLMCSLFPSLVLQMYNLPVADAAIWVTRLVGESVLGFATLMWFGRKTATVESRRSIALALLIQDAVGFIASMEYPAERKHQHFWLDEFPSSMAPWQSGMLTSCSSDQATLSRRSMAWKIDSWRSEQGFIIPTPLTKKVIRMPLITCCSELGMD